MSDVNLFDVAVEDDADDPEGYRTSYARIGPLVEREEARPVASTSFRPGQSICPYHYEIGFEEWLIVLAGRRRCARRRASRSCARGTWRSSRTARRARTR